MKNMDADTKKQMEQEINDLFNEMDEDGNHSLDENEIYRAYQNMGI
jgi:Ca2+-binding EF-hand superfamily protein